MTDCNSAIFDFFLILTRIFEQTSFLINKIIVKGGTGRRFIRSYYKNKLHYYRKQLSESYKN